MDIETIIYIIFFLIFIVARLFKGVKDKAGAERPVIPDHSRQQDASSPQPPQPEKKPSFGDVFGDLLNEFEEERERPYESSKNSASESQQKIDEEKHSGFIDPEHAKRLMEEEGMTAFQDYDKEDSAVASEEITDGFGDDLTGSEIGGEIEEQHFEFDPREAFLLKSLLERPYK